MSVRWDVLKRHGLVCITVLQFDLVETGGERTLKMSTPLCTRVPGMYYSVSNLTPVDYDARLPARGRSEIDPRRHRHSSKTLAVARKSSQSLVAHTCTPKSRGCLGGRGGRERINPVPMHA